MPEKCAWSGGQGKCVVEDEFPEVAPSSQFCYLACKRFGGERQERSSMTDQRGEESRRAEEENRLRVEKERRGEELREAWRRHHPSQSEQDEKGRLKKRPPA